ncbi:MAG: hypothetical protein COZ91_01035 [Candidatus Nealsonbacteria bacterium CG_4_8_14_3_um_filter_39_7]|nr:MAG: hypothetical protein COS96_01950 [Candidatus Nealsonbacteria bacterium CG07_land_8_20_14_0_80_39_13]PIW91471.1 MAG: hypothetical protein COZ91_01035 [Candidatus Nealsonbacteria bacterium CG_4_8_14_3_um_filter_39_7]
MGIMKFLADENIAPRVVLVLRENGFNVTSICEEKFSGASDEKILKLAQKQKRIILTHDKDFGDLIHQPFQPPCGVILLRLRNQSPDSVINHLIPFLGKIGLEKIKNRLVILCEGKIRII